MSLSGSGVAVATGLVAFALGVDGGGSIRIPAALNGVFGLKPTWGRVSRRGDAVTGSVAHLGPLAGSTLDLARVLDLMGSAPTSRGLADRLRAAAVEGGSRAGSVARSERAADRDRGAGMA